ncbi:MAG: hypothetical protein ABIR79_06400 [Candidatus Binatia bacterium]
MTVDHVVHVVYWASGFVMLGAQVFLAAPWRERRERSALMPAVVWAVVPALFLIGFGLFGRQTGLAR